jgi:hypothetical protein
MNDSRSRRVKCLSQLACALSTCVPSLVAAMIYVAFGVAHACEMIQLCVNWAQLENEDQGYGDLFIELESPARGARVTLIRPYPEPALGMFLDADGCGSFDSQFVTGHKAIIYTESVLGFGTGGQFHIRTYASNESMVNDSPGMVVVDIPSIPEDWRVEVDVPDSGLQLITLQATATEIIHRLHSLDGSLLTGGRTLKIWLDPLAQNAAAWTAQEIKVGTAGDDQGVSALRKKFIMGHEIGHWIQLQLAGGWQYNYNYGPDTESMPLDPYVMGNPWDEPCGFAVEILLSTSSINPNRHGIRSAEFSSGAMPEGFGHFVASVAFNSDLSEDADGAFRYYKDPDEELLESYIPFEEGGRVVSLLGGALPATPLGGADRWVAEQCPNDWVHPLQEESLGEEVTSEIDWLKFFWRFMTAEYNGAGTPPGFWDVVHLVRFTQTNDPWDDFVVWPHMLNAVQNAASGLEDYEEHFIELSIDHGVYNGDM